MKSREYLTEIRKSEGLVRAVLRKIEIKDGVATFYLATDVNFTENDTEYAIRVSARYLSAPLKADVKIMKSVPDAAGIRRAVLDLLKTFFPAVAAFVEPDDVEVAIESGGGNFIIGIGETELSLVSDGVLDRLCKELMRQFCGVWYGSFRKIEKERGEIEAEELPPQETVSGPRFFAIEEYTEIDGGKPKYAIYIADLVKEMQNISVCGTVSFIEERETKNGKPYFSISISDGTGQLRISYFSKKATLEKVRGIKAGDSICLSGEEELYNGTLSFRAMKIDYGRPPKNFVPESRPSRPVPPKYKTVFPSPASDFVQGMLFDDTSLPEEFRKREFVVFDLETTGLNNTAASGAMDRIIEIGAVKIRDGQICEKFSSFVACPVKLTQEIVKLTGITDEMLVGAPNVGDVMTDFYKFAHGSTLVGHNVQFDYKFIRHYGEEEGYIFDNRQYDTVTFAQEQLILSNYKLNTVADYFGFSFNHHRAYDDAFVTAKIFIALVKKKQGLPNG